MKIARVLHESQARVGVLAGEELCLLAGIDDPRDVLESAPDPLARFADLAAASDERVPLAGLVFLPPIGRFHRDVLCVGWNYWDHFEEGIGKRDGQEVDRPAAPTFFTKAPGSLTGAGADIPFDPAVSGKWDYEGEIALVIGRSGRSIPQAEAMEHVFGYMLANDVSQRDLQRRHGGQWLKGKSLDGCSPIAPWIVTRDEIDFDDIRLEVFVNGDLRQSATPALMAFALPEMLAELSFGMTLQAGDVVLTGTPAGVGMARTPPLYLAEGDVVSVRGTGLGVLENRLVAGDLHGRSEVTPL